MYRCDNYFHFNVYHCRATVDLVELEDWYT